MTDKDNNKSTDKTADTDNTASSKASTSTDVKLTPAQATKIAAQAKQNSAKTTATDAKTTAGKSAPEPSQSRGSNKPPISNRGTAASTGKQKLSKTAVLALLLALGAGAGVGGHYWWQQQQTELLEQRVNAGMAANIKQLDKHLQKQISLLQSQAEQRASAMIKGVEERSASRISVLEQEIKLILDRQPNNWQITEAEYLIRMAGRVLWLEKDVKTAIALITDADTRLRDLKDPRLLSIRQLIHQDIEQLKLLPTLESDEIILSFMGLAKQIEQLPLASVQLPEEAEIQESNALSSDVNDWQANLAKSWYKFKEEFITIRRRTGNVEPLMEPQFQQNLYNNLDLKIQQAQWAVSQRDTQLYKASVTNIQQWLSVYFDMTSIKTQQFNARLSELKVIPVTVEYPQNLASQQALQKLLNNNKSNGSAEPKAPKKQLGGVKPQKPADIDKPTATEAVTKPLPTVDKPEISTEGKA
ncbi:uroporphyrinogen-III C-methyltransferase [Colwelliaceae bacterium BS250]